LHSPQIGSGGVANAITLFGGTTGSSGRRVARVKGSKGSLIGRRRPILHGGSCSGSGRHAELGQFDRKGHARAEAECPLHLLKEVAVEQPVDDRVEGRVGVAQQQRERKQVDRNSPAARIFRQKLDANRARQIRDPADGEDYHQGHEHRSQPAPAATKHQDSENKFLKQCNSFQNFVTGGRAKKLYN
jgi:hypothetical protein